MSESTRAIDGRTDFHDTLRRAFAEAAELGCPALWLCDPDFSDWPLGERRVVESLSAWVASRRRLTLIAGHFDALVQRHARWVEWRRSWAHVVDCRSNSEIEPVRLPTVLLAPGLLSVHLVDAVHHRGSISHDPKAMLSCREMIDAVLQRSVEAFPATTTGL